MTPEKPQPRTDILNAFEDRLWDMVLDWAHAHHETRTLLVGKLWKKDPQLPE